jgi:hypothetical protein
MRFRVVQTHLRGVPISRRDLMSAAGIIGELVTVCEPDDFHKGAITIAKLHDPAGGKAGIELVACLYAPVLHIVAPQGMLLTGHERIRECDRYVSHYVQGWWARLP